MEPLPDEPPPLDPLVEPPDEMPDVPPVFPVPADPEVVERVGSDVSVGPDREAVGSAAPGFVAVALGTETVVRFGGFGRFDDLVPPPPHPARTSTPAVVAAVATVPIRKIRFFVRRMLHTPPWSTFVGL
ncbi:hypothetical protein [Embleya hyalina]|uniref:Uncharacterized protein n=1 Tax=Embleya hyalina TaxID=516124 RepID=A0A401Z387_9ACTN|nr:hypothetical protein [Embleya hyalina]GCE01343.1 hypothetical protein EHYA_09109 [Embleya hyalina]